MMDIVEILDDIIFMDTQVAKGTNVLQVQLGSLEYLQQFGIDITFFLDPDKKFQNESFKSYLVQVLTENGINVNQLIDTQNTFDNLYQFYVGGQENYSGSLIR